jgi:hypothetical protein
MEGGMSTREVFLAASIWALVSAIGAAISVEFGTRGLAWGWTASFLVSALAAAYCLGRLL